MLNSLLGVLSDGVPPVTGSFESIASATASGSSTTVTFNSIPSTYSHLQIRAITKNSGTASSGVGSYSFRFNSDSGSNYANHYIDGNGTSPFAAGSISNTEMTARRSSANSNASFTNMVGVSIIDIHDYASTSKYKTVRTFGGTDLNTQGALALSSSLWRSTSAVNSITFISGSGNWTNQTTFAIYGIKG